MARIKKAVIFGTGLVGGSLGLLIKKRRPDIKVWGVDQPAVLHQARKIKAIDEAGQDLRSALAGADFVFLAIPLPVIIPTLKKIAPFLPESAIVIDTGSTKEKIVKAAARLGKVSRQFIGGHPLAGSEKSGIGAAQEKILDGAVFVLIKPPKPVPGKKAKTPSARVLNRAEKFLTSLGFRVLWLKPKAHDEAVAFVSHLPYFLAIILADLTGRAKERKILLRLAAGGWLSATRVAASAPGWGASILAGNRRRILRQLDKFAGGLARIKKLIAEKKDRQLLRLFQQAARLRKTKEKN